MTPAATGGNALRGITLKICSVAVFVAMFGLLKSAGQIPSGQLVFFRSFFAVLPILIMLIWQGQLHGVFRTSNPISHIVRGLVGVTSMGFSFYALTRLPLPEVVTLSYAQPLLIVVFSAIFLREVIRLYRWSAVVVGLIGVMIVTWPNLTVFNSGSAGDQTVAIGVIAALIAAAFSAIATLLVRRLVHTERTATIVLWFSLTASAAGLATIPFGWEPLSVLQTLALIMGGVCGGVGQILMTEAYRHAEASTVAPFEYTSLILSIIVGYFAFGDLPTPYTIIGGSIVVAAGIFIIWREHRLGLETAKARKVTPPQ